MCDMMAAALSLDIRRAPGGTEADAVNHIWSMISKAGLGAMFAPGWLEPSRPTALRSPLELAQWDESMRYNRLVAERLRSLAQKPNQNVVVFLLMSAPGAGCICDATWNNFSPPEPHPEKAPIVPLLREMLGLSFVRLAAFYYGPIGLAEPERILGFEVETEAPEQFIEHFFTEVPGKIIGTGASGFFCTPLK